MKGKDVTPCKVVARGSRQETLNLGFMVFGTHHQGAFVILRELILLPGFDPVSHSFTVRGVTTPL